MWKKKSKTTFWMVLGGFSVSNFGQKMRTALCRLSFHWHAWRLSFRNFRFKMPRSERVILHVSINMGRLPGQRVMSKCWEGPLNNFEIVCSHQRLQNRIVPIFNFSFTWSSRRSEIQYNRLPTGKKSFEWDSTGFSGVMPVFEEFSFHLEIFCSETCLTNQKSSKYGSFLQLCVCDLDLAAQVLWVSW